MRKRSECRCRCHGDPTHKHMVPCCEPDEDLGAAYSERTTRRTELTAQDKVMLREMLERPKLRPEYDPDTPASPEY